MKSKKEKGKGMTDLDMVEETVYCWLKREHSQRQDSESVQGGYDPTPCEAVGRAASNLEEQPEPGDSLDRKIR